MNCIIQIYTDKRHLIYKHIYSVPLQSNFKLANKNTRTKNKSKTKFPRKKKQTKHTQTNKNNKQIKNDEK
jgi:hypothetical protein